MPAVRRTQNSALLYPLITFVALFLVATIVAIIFYSQFEKQKTLANESKRDLAEVANQAQLRDIQKIVGAKKTQETYLGKMVDYHDQMVSLILGAPLPKTSAEIKVESVDNKFKETIDLLDKQKFGAGKAAPEPPANPFVELLAREQFAAAAQQFDENMKNALPMDKLQQTWQAVVGQLGAFKKQIGSRTEKQGGLDVVFVTCEFQNGPLDIKVVYDANGRIAGLLAVPTPPEVLKNLQDASAPSPGQDIDLGTIDPNTTGLIRIIVRLKETLENTADTVGVLNNQLEKLHVEYDDFRAATQQKEDELLAKKDELEKQVYKIKTDYDELQDLLRKTSDERVQTLLVQLDQTKADNAKMEADLLETGAKLATAQERINHLQNQVQAVMPPPDSNVPAYKPDGKVMLVDNHIVHLNIGSDDRVFRGLTFSVYNKGMPIPKDGKGKAEIEVFDVGKNVSAARVTRSEKRSPIVVDDIVANLIWDSDKTNLFAVVGDFDLNGDGTTEYDAFDRIKNLVEKWGGRVADSISVDTDFLILGRPPQILPKPTVEQVAQDPMATEKYEASLKKLAHYEEVQNQAQDLRVPVFNTERFLYFIGYKALSSRPDAF
ncbi:MAG TPA: DUF3887 domain-containing protein [Sedimentisphaerales bacterium]|nr:DUF3887 domain-containing protein [Sedimentisphaerales bacterium]